MERIFQRSMLGRRAQLDYATLWGAAAAFGLVLLAILLGGGIASFIDIKSLLIVLGGTFGATLITFPLEDVRKTLDVIRPAVFPEENSAARRLDRLIEMAKVSRVDGELSLENYIHSEPDPFFSKCLELVVDGVKPAQIRRILELEISFLEDRHRRGAKILQTMGAIAPAMGLIGTLIGLVRMLEHLEDPSHIGPGMALALLTTFYGALLAHIVFLPLAGKLRARSEEEQLTKEMTLEGVLCIVEGDNPRIIEQRLQSFLPPGQRYSRFESRGAEMGPGENTPSFIILFTDLSIILLAFLIFLNALALPNLEKRYSAIRSVGEQFTGTHSPVPGSGAQKEPGYAPDMLSHLPEMSMSERYSELAPIADKGGIAHSQEEDRFLLTLSGDELFTAESPQIRAGFLPLLRELAEELKSYPLHAEITVHSPPSSPRSSNPYARSNAEGAALLRFLLDRGVPLNKLRVAGVGGFQPAFSNETEEGQKKNHRIEILFTLETESAR